MAPPSVRAPCSCVLFVVCVLCVSFVRAPGIYIYAFRMCVCFVANVECSGVVCEKTGVHACAWVSLCMCSGLLCVLGRLGVLVCYHVCFSIAAPLPSWSLTPTCLPASHRLLAASNRVYFRPIPRDKVSLPPRLCTRSCTVGRSNSKLLFVCVVEKK